MGSGFYNLRKYNSCFGLMDKPHQHRRSLGIIEENLARVLTVLPDLSLYSGTSYCNCSPSLKREVLDQSME